MGTARFGSVACRPLRHLALVGTIDAMITTFGSLYAGHVDLDDLGYEATPVNDRWLSDEQLATVFEKARPSPS